jgi:hypothetical protein
MFFPKDVWVHTEPTKYNLKLLVTVYENHTPAALINVVVVHSLLKLNKIVVGVKPHIIFDFQLYCYYIPISVR